VLVALNKKLGIDSTVAGCLDLLQFVSSESFERYSSTPGVVDINMNS
jgi:hypothetical protein